MAQKNGGKEFVLTCSDHLKCNWRDVVDGVFVQGEFYLLYRPKD